MTREEQIKQEAEEQAKELYLDKHNLKWMFKHGVEWADEHPKPIWKDAQGDDLPEIDREVIVLCDDGHDGYKVCFGHRPNPKGYYGKNLTTGEKVSKYRYEVETYDKGGWNFPDVRWWLNVELPNMEEHNNESKDRH